MKAASLVALLSHTAAVYLARPFLVSDYHYHENRVQL
jgi:hypothetical protein